MIGLTCLASVSSLSVIDTVLLDLAVFVQSYAYAGFVLFAPDLLHLDLPMLLQSFAQSGPMVSALDFLKSGLLLPLQSSTCFGLTSSVFGAARMELYFSVLDAVSLALSLLPQSFT